VQGTIPAAILARAEGATLYSSVPKGIAEFSICASLLLDFLSRSQFPGGI